MNRHFVPACSGSRNDSATRAPNVPAGLALAGLLAAVLLVAGHLQASAVTYTVCPSGCNYPTIQAAVTAVPASRTQPITILVSAGTYRERVRVNNKLGTASNTLVIQAQGADTLDGSDLYPTSLWTLYNTGPVYWATYTPISLMSPPKSQVFVNGVRYTYVSGSSYGALSPSSYGYDSTTDRVYVNAGGVNPGSQSTYIGNHDRQFGFDVNSSNYLTIDGFTVLRNDQQGINIRGATTTPPTINIQSIVVNHCTSAQNWNQGIFVSNCSACSLGHDTTYSNANHGIYLLHSANCDVSHCASYLNDLPTAVRGGKNGIKIGDSDSTADVSDVTVDDNVVHDNEDTGIECHGASRILLRRNVAYDNHDHGYDNNKTDSTAWLNNVAMRNEHDGFSAEISAHHIRLDNCILWHNALNGATLQGGMGGVRELFVADTTGLESNYNLIAGLNGEDHGSGSWYRTLVEAPQSSRHGTWANWQLTGFDANSYSSNPALEDTVHGGATIKDTTDVVDQGRSDLMGWTTPFWLGTDPRGFSPHKATNRSGGGSPSYSDIGAYEFDPVPAAIAILGFGPDSVDCTKFNLTWPAPNEDVNYPAVGPAALYELKSSIQSFTTWTGGTGLPLGLAPLIAPTWQSWQVTVGFGQHRYFGIGTKDANGQWSGSNVVYISGPPSGWIDCFGEGGMFAGGGGGGGGFGARPAPGPASVETATATGFAENTLLNGVVKGIQAADLFRLPAMTASGGNAYSVRIREVTGHALSLDRVRLLTVDHSSSVRTFMASGKPVLGTRAAPVHAEDATGTDVTARVDGSTTDTFNGDSGAVINVKLAAEPGGSTDPVVIEASGLGWSSSGILVQVPDQASGWRTVERVQPRLYFDELAVDSVASTQVRLYFLGRHSVRFVGRVLRSSERPTLQWAPLLKADDARMGDALAAVTSSDSTALALAGPDTLRLAFASPALAVDQVRECFLAVDATLPSQSSSSASQFSSRAVPLLPARFALRQNQPNPFSASTAVRFDLPVGVMVRLEVFDAQGRRVELLANHYFPAGEHTLPWNASSADKRLGPGVYFSRIEAGTFRDWKKMVLLP